MFVTATPGRLEFKAPFFQDVAAGIRTLKHTPLYEAHVRLGAHGRLRRLGHAGLVPGRDPRGAPATRTAVGLFDVSHMGEVHFRGPRAGEAVQRLVTNDVGALGDGRALTPCLPAQRAASSTI